LYVYSRQVSVQHAAECGTSSDRVNGEAVKANEEDFSYYLCFLAELLHTSHDSIVFRGKQYAKHSSRIFRIMEH